MKKIIASKILLLVWWLSVAGHLYAMAAPPPFFGLHVVAGKVDAAKYAGGNLQRVFLYWQNLESSPGQYSFPDDNVLAAGARGISTIFTLMPISVWDHTGYWDENGGTAKTRVEYPNNINAWLQMVQKLVERYDGDGREDLPGMTLPVRHWQICNEFWQWNDSPERYADFLAKTRAAILNADFGAKVVLVGLTSTQYLALDAGLTPENWIWSDAGSTLTRVSRWDLVLNKDFQETKKKAHQLLKSAKGHFDYADFHSYTTDPYLITYQAKWMNSTMSKYGYSRPLLSLECGGPMHIYSLADHSRHVVKRYVLGAAANLVSICWSSLMPTMSNPSQYVNLSLISPNGNPKPAYFTYQLVTSKLSGMSFKANESRSDRSFHLYRFTDKRRDCLVGWTDYGSQSTYAYLPAAPHAALRLSYAIEDAGQASPQVITKNAFYGVARITLTPTPVFIEVAN